ncbi:MAG: hydrogenase-1 expression HyaE [Methylophaga sp.]|nr:MAG: hydrogenase-1 expression HyaE [Methylophaga sp.]
MSATPTVLIDRLSSELNYPLIDLTNLDDFLSANKHSVLFFTEDANRFAESNDVAIVLPELVKLFPDLTPAVIARDDEKKLQSIYGFRSWPALVFMRGDKYLDAITGIQDWSEYIDQIKQILASKTSKPKSIGIPVVSR